jgi:hypothetical protein
MPYASTSVVDTEHLDLTIAESDSVTDEKALVARILRSRHLAKSNFLSAFFLYICNRALEDPTVRITEMELGTAVFERGPNFDPREDNIVRNYVRQLRKRLENFYALEGADEEIMIDIPRGGYAPAFTRRTLPTRDLPESAENAIERVVGLEEDSSFASESLRSKRRLFYSICFGVIVAFALLRGVFFFFPRALAAIHVFPPRNALWTQMFSEDRNTIIVPSDTAFVVVQQANHRTFTLAQYLRWFSTKATTDGNLEMAYLRGETYTSMPSLEIVAMTQRLPEVIQSRFMIRAPRALRFEDLREDNIILLGSSYSNPWCELFENQLNFQVINHPESDHYWIVDEHPPHGGRQLYESNYGKNSLVTYASVAMLPNLSGKGHVLIIQGLDAAATWGAADFVLHRFNPDKVPGSFELLLEITSLDASSKTTNSRVVQTRNISYR